MENSKLKLEQWLANKDLDSVLRGELENITSEDDIYDRFYKELEFGTGGLRGVLGAGTNRMNIYTVGKATQGLANYINKNYENPTVAIAYDSRINSQLFAKEAADILIANHIKVFLYKELMPTPALSFAVRHFSCAAGIMVTASHNPSKYNGYKVYNDEGCQITLDAAAKVLSCIEEIDIFKDVRHSGKEPNYIDEIVVEEYLDNVKKQSTGVKSMDNLSIVFTPLNGAGNKPVRRILNSIGINDIKIVKEQELPDGEFPTCTYPNPEKKEALKVGLDYCNKLMEKGDAPDLLLATDPDCDRIGTAVRDGDEYKLINGNEVGVLLLDFICQRKNYLKIMPERPVAIKTIVSSKMADVIAHNYGVKIIEVLTGFKFIGEQIGKLEEKGEEDRFIFGFEESYGYLSGSYVRDKDAVNGAMLICEMAAYYKEQGKTLVDRLEELYMTYGFYCNDLMDFAFEGAIGMEKMAHIMSALRGNPPTEIIGKKVVSFTDFENPKEGINLPKANVLELVLECESSIMIRPSGTEPKLKIYLSAKSNTKREALETIEKLKIDIDKKINV